MILRKSFHVRRHTGIVDPISVGRAAVIALVDGIHRGNVLKPSAAEGVPVAVGPEQSVENDEWRTVLTVLVVKELHTYLIGKDSTVVKSYKGAVPLSPVPCPL